MSQLQKIIILILLLLAISSTSILAEAEAERIPMRVTRSEVPIRVDGRLDEAEWANALKIDLGYEISPSENIPAIVRTEFYITYDDQNIYIGWKAFDPEPGKIRARIREHDSVWGDDSVSVKFDTFNDERNSFNFVCNPLGVQSDRDWGGSSWDAIWESAGQLTEWGYAVEMAIPFKELRFPAGAEEQVWGFSLMRSMPRKIDYRFSDTPNDRNTNCSMCLWDKLVGFDAVSPGRDIEITPAFSMARSDSLSEFPGGNMGFDESAMQLGLTGTWGVTPNFTASALMDADFSEVEADSVQIDINRRFPVLYTNEKRPFFLEGREFFSGIRTRAIINPIYGAKFTGKQGKNSIGMMFIRDGATRIFFPGPEYGDSTYLPFENNSMSLNYGRDIFDSSSARFSYNDRSAGEYSNRIFSGSSRLRLSRQDSLRLNYSGSLTNYDAATAAEFEQSEDSFYGQSFGIDYSHDTRNWEFDVEYERDDSNYRNDLAMKTQNGTESFNTGFGYNWYGDSESIITNAHASASYRREDEIDGGMLGQSYSLNGGLNGRMQSNLGFGYSLNDQTVDGVPFQLGGFYSHFGIRPSAMLNFGFFVSRRDSIDYEHLRKGEVSSFSPRISLNLGRNMEIDLNVGKTSFTVDGQELYSYNDLKITPVIHFSAKSHLRMKFQYIDLSQNQNMYESEVETNSRDLLSQIVYSHQFNARTFIFVGYNDSYYGTSEYKLQQTDRTYFAKMSYAWSL
jgi:hypothetical protein